MKMMGVISLRKFIGRCKPSSCRSEPSEVSDPIRSDTDGGNRSPITCPKCGEHCESEEEHHLSKHAVTELMEGSFTRKYVEINCSLECLNNKRQIERILKVNNTHKAVALFEEYREMMKTKAREISRKIPDMIADVNEVPAMIADGNEVLRFYCTSVVCSLGMNGSSRLCKSEACGACQILRHGFGAVKKTKRSVGILTVSINAVLCKKYKYLKQESLKPPVRKALLACRVIAGRVYETRDEWEKIEFQPGYDSIVRTTGLLDQYKELYSLDHRALLPFSVVIVNI